MDEATQRIGQRVVVTGMAGAGKSTFSRELSKRTSLPLIHLDLFSWRPGWVRVPAAEMLEIQRNLLNGESWIVDSNDVDEELLLERADTLIILNTPWWICAWRAFRRGLRRPSEIQLPEGCEESLSQRLKNEWGIVWRNWRNRHVVPSKNLELAMRSKAQLTVYIVGSREESGYFLDAVSLRGSAPS